MYVGAIEEAAAKAEKMAAGLRSRWPTTFQLSASSPPSARCSRRDATFVAFPAYDGEVGILPDRAPLLAQLGHRRAAGRERRRASASLFVSGGFAQMVDNRLTLLTEEASEVSAIAPAAAEEGLAAARALPATSDEAWRKRQRAYDRARALARLRR